MFTITRILVVITTFIATTISFAQVGVGTTTPNADALLEINSTVANPGGVLLPRMALVMTTNPAPLSADVAGMIVYNTATAGDVTPGFYYNDGAIWIKLGAGTASADWSILGNAGTAAGTNFIGTTDGVDFVTRTNNIERMRVLSDGRVSVNNATPFTTGHLVSHSTTASHALAVRSTSTGAGLYSQKTGAGFGVHVDATNAAAGGIFSDLNNAGSDDAVIGHANNSGGYGGGWFLNATTADGGPGRGTAELGYGVLGMANGGGWGNTGVYGSASSGSRAGSGVYGAMTNGTSAVAAGALAYRLDKNGGAAYYGGYFWDLNTGGGAGGDDHTEGDGTRMSSPNSDTRPRVNVGIGAVGGLMGGWARGDVYGFTTRGERYGLYVQGREFTNDVITQLSDNNSQNRIATYVPTSTSVDITSKGMGTLNNGSARVNFAKNFTSIATSEEPVIVTVTPLGQSNGVYLVRADKNGFSIKENNNGNSNVKFTWIAMATKKGYEKVENPKELLLNDYDKKLNSFMGEKPDKSTQDMWWDGNEIRFSNTPEPKEYTKPTNVHKQKEVK